MLTDGPDGGRTASCGRRGQGPAGGEGPPPVARSPAAPRITVVQALPKGDRGELAVETMTETGVDAIVPWQAARCITQWKGERGRSRWRSGGPPPARRASSPAGSASRRCGRRMTTKQVAALLATADFAAVLHEEGAYEAAGHRRAAGRGLDRAGRGPRGRVSPRRNSRPSRRREPSRTGWDAVCCAPRRRARRRRRCCWAARAAGADRLVRGPLGREGPDASPMTVIDRKSVVAARRCQSRFMRGMTLRGTLAARMGTPHGRHGEERQLAGREPATRPHRPARDARSPRSPSRARRSGAGGLRAGDRGTELRAVSVTTDRTGTSTLERIGFDVRWLSCTATLDGAVRLLAVAQQDGVSHRRLPGRDRGGARDHAQGQGDRGASGPVCPRRPPARVDGKVVLRRPCSATARATCPAVRHRPDPCPAPVRGPAVTVTVTVTVTAIPGEVTRARHAGWADSGKPRSRSRRCLG